MMGVLDELGSRGLIDWPDRLYDKSASRPRRRMSLTWLVPGLWDGWDTLSNPSYLVSVDHFASRDAAAQNDSRRVRRLFVTGSSMSSGLSKPTTNSGHIGLRSFVRTRHSPALSDTRIQQRWPLTCINRP
jgi:hypothetical protein